MDYQKFNAITYNDVYPVSREQGCLDATAGSRMFFTMVVLSTYNHLPMAEKDIPKTEFTIKYGLFEFTTMPFGLMTAPTTHQWLWN